MLYVKIIGYSGEKPMPPLQIVSECVIDSVKRVRELGLSSADVAVTFPKDVAEYTFWRGSILAEISGLYGSSEPTSKVKDDLAGCVWGAVQACFPKAIVECVVTNVGRQVGYCRSPWVEKVDAAKV